MTEHDENPGRIASMLEANTRKLRGIRTFRDAFSEMCHQDYTLYYNKFGNADDKYKFLQDALSSDQEMLIRFALFTLQSSMYVEDHTLTDYIVNVAFNGSNSKIIRMAIMTLALKYQGTMNRQIMKMLYDISIKHHDVAQTCDDARTFVANH